MTGLKDLISVEDHTKLLEFTILQEKMSGWANCFKTLFIENRYEY
jgi:hypothetical protein